MARTLIIVDRPSGWPFKLPNVEVVSARDYLNDEVWSACKHARVFNLCRSYRYQTIGYYVSLLAEARGHRPIPKIGTLQDLRHQSLLRVASAEVDELIQSSLKSLQSDSFVLSIYFARNLAKRYDRLSRALFNIFPAPFLQGHFTRLGDRWYLRRLTPIPASAIPESHREFVMDAGTRYFSKGIARPTRRRMTKYHLAILFGDSEPTPPSDRAAIDRFVAAAGELDISSELVERDDYGRVAEFDALFIRETTVVTGHTYRFARRAEAEGLVVMDDPDSIVRCTNKVYLAELLARHGVPMPRTEIIHRRNSLEALSRLGLPCVLKTPDSSFSLGVTKVESEKAYRQMVEKLLDESELLIGQEFLRTDYDWRVGIIDRKPLYACKYYMARGHWQIYNHSAKGGGESGTDFEGDYETMPVEMAPKRVVQMAVKAANLIGDGLYGVDVKYMGGRPFVIEINDNPSIEAGVEDACLGDELYHRIMMSFYRRLVDKRR